LRDRRAAPKVAHMRSALGSGHHKGPGRRAWGVGLIVVAALVGPVFFVPSAGAAGGPTAWKQHAYFDAVKSELELGTSPVGIAASRDCGWAGGIDVINVNHPDWPHWDCGAVYMWAKKCDGGSQMVQFTKKIYLPGPAETLTVSLASLNDRPLTMKILINNRSALTTLKSVHMEDLPGKRDLFDIGFNTLTVEAKKGNTGKGPCNTNEDDYGVYADIDAVFAADIEATAPQGFGTTSGVFSGSFMVRNNGPGAASEVEVSAGAYTRHLVTASSPANAAVFVSGAGIEPDKCSYYFSADVFQQESYTGYSTYCDIGPLKPGQSVTVHVVYKYRVPNGPFYEAWPISWSANGDLVDPNHSNNGGMRLQHACRNDPSHPNPRCTVSVGETSNPGSTAGSTTTTAITPTAAPGSFVLAPPVVSNPNAKELKINAAAGTAVDDHTGANGGAGNGGNWKVSYTWQVPKSLRPGRSFSVAVGIKVADVEPPQPLGFQMGLTAPDFAQTFGIHYPNRTQGAKDFTIPVPADLKDAKSLSFSVYVISAEVTYTYQHARA